MITFPDGWLIYKILNSQGEHNYHVLAFYNDNSAAWSEPLTDVSTIVQSADEFKWRTLTDDTFVLHKKKEGCIRSLQRVLHASELEDCRSRQIAVERVSMNNCLEVKKNN